MRPGERVWGRWVWDDGGAIWHAAMVTAARIQNLIRIRIRIHKGCSLIHEPGREDLVHPVVLPDVLTPLLGDLLVPRLEGEMESFGVRS